MPVVLLLLLSGWLVACDRAGAPAGELDSGRPDPARPAAVYGRRFLFLAGREAEPVAVVLDFATLDQAAAERRSASAWRARGDRWEPIFELDWAGEPVREPWRLLPHGPFRVLVDEGGEIESLRSRGVDPAFRLEPMEVVGAWARGDVASYRLLRATVELGGERHEGLLVDGRIAGAPPGSAAPGEAVVTDGDALRLILPTDTVGPAIAWNGSGDPAGAWDAVSLVVDSVTTGSAPTGWRIEEPAGELRGELRPAGAALPLTPLGGAAWSPSELLVVRGWIELRGERRPVFGVLRYGQG